MMLAPHKPIRFCTSSDMVLDVRLVSFMATSVVSFLIQFEPLRRTASHCSFGAPHEFEWLIDYRRQRLVLPQGVSGIPNQFSIARLYHLEFLIHS